MKASSSKLLRGQSLTSSSSQTGLFTSTNDTRVTYPPSRQRAGRTNSINDDDRAQLVCSQPQPDTPTDLPMEHEDLTGANYSIPSPTNTAHCNLVSQSSMGFSLPPSYSDTRVSATMTSVGQVPNRPVLADVPVHRIAISDFPPKVQTRMRAFDDDDDGLIDMTDLSRAAESLRKAKQGRRSMCILAAAAVMVATVMVLVTSGLVYIAVEYSKDTKTMGSMLVSTGTNQMVLTQNAISNVDLQDLPFLSPPDLDTMTRVTVRVGTVVRSFSVMGYDLIENQSLTIHTTMGPKIIIDVVGRIHLKNPGEMAVLLQGPRHMFATGSKVRRQANTDTPTTPIEASTPAVPNPPAEIPTQVVETTTTTQAEIPTQIPASPPISVPPTEIPTQEPQNTPIPPMQTTTQVATEIPAQVPPAPVQTTTTTTTQHVNPVTTTTTTINTTPVGYGLRVGIAGGMRGGKLWCCS